MLRDTIKFVNNFNNIWHLYSTYLPQLSKCFIEVGVLSTIYSCREMQRKERREKKEGLAQDKHARQERHREHR